MSRPAQLEAQIARVQEIQAEMTKGDTQDNVELNDDGTPKTVTPPEAVTPPPVVEPPATINKEEYDKLEQRFRTLQGMYNADSVRLRGELKEALDAIKELEDRVVAAEATAKTPNDAPVKYITAEDESEYGDTLDMVRRAAREEAENLARKREEKFLNEIAELKNQLGYVQSTVVPKVDSITRSQEEQVKAEFWGAIETQVPNWRTINDSADFRAWLIAEDPLTGATRQQFLAQAQYNYNAPRVIGFFKEWERTKAGGQTPAPKNSAHSELEKMVSPGASKGGNVPVTTEPKIWSHDAIGKFYADVTKGVYANKPEERKKIEADIFAAQREGRVR